MTHSVEHSQFTGPNTVGLTDGIRTESAGIPAVCSAPAIPTEAEFAAELLDDAESARRNVAALAEILAGCPPEYKISAYLFRSLLETAMGHLENTVDGVRLLAAAPMNGGAA